jgi:arsenate reductase
MASGYLQHFAGDWVEVRSAGSAPADSINPSVVIAMKEEGIDLSAQRPKILTDEAVEASDVVITMGCGDLDWNLDDPAGQGIDSIRPIRDQIKSLVKELISTL